MDWTVVVGVLGWLALVLLADRWWVWRSTRAEKQVVAETEAFLVEQAERRRRHTQDP